MHKIIILLIIYVLYKIDLLGKLVITSLPFIFGFVLANIFYPIELKFNKKMPKYLSICIIITIILIIIFVIVKVLLPLLMREGSILINVIINYLLNISIKFDIDIPKLNEFINYKQIINSISISLNYIENIILCFISFIYFLIDMDKIRLYIKNINSKLSNYLIYINNDFSKYIESLIKISIISFFEYTLVFFIIGHSNPILVGVVSAILNMIPYIGGMLTVLITILLCPSMIIKISITYILLGLIDGYVITPYVYGKYNKINPILGLFALSVGGLFGIVGVICSIPVLVIITSTFNYFKNSNNIV